MRPTVDLMSASMFWFDGLSTEPDVSLPTLPAQKLAAVRIPELDPPVLATGRPSKVASRSGRRQHLDKTMTIRILRYAFATALAALALTATTYAGHESNNRAELTGPAGVTGQAIVNYVKGTEGWASTVSVMGLPDGIYTFAVRLNTGAPQPICSFEISGEGRSGCSDNDAALLGFNQALILDGDDNVVAGGVFVRRGGKREQ